MSSEKGIPAILLAEDYAVVKMILAEYIRSAGCAVDLAADGREAVEAFRGRAFDLVLMDIEMPGMNGLEAARLMRSSEEESGSGTRTPIIAMTAYDSPDALQSFSDAGMDGCLPKPVRREALVQEVRKWIGSAAPREGDPAGASSAGQAERTPIDLKQAIGDLFDKDEFLRSVEETFLADLESQLDEMAAAIERKDGENLSREAHSIKGAALFLTADRLGTIARELEQCGRGGDFDAAIELLAHLREEARRLEDYVTAELGRSSDPA